MENRCKFPLGDIVVTRGIAEATTDSDDFDSFVADCLKRYANCDWGDTCEEDAKLNDEALEQGERILAAYEYAKNHRKIWIITEWDRSVTTVLFPEEY